MNLRPMNDRIIVKRAEVENKTPAGIVLPTPTENPVTGTVLAVGPGRVNSKGEPIRIHISVGDTIIFGMHSGTDTKFQGEELLILREEDVFAVCIEQEKVAEPEQKQDKK